MTKTILNIVIMFSFLIVAFTSFSSFASAHPGNTASDGCHYCRTNCDYWGVPWNQRHCHGGSSYSSPAYVAPSIISNSDCPSYGFAYLGSCYELPSNSRKSLFSGFECNYGYEKVGYDLSAKCLKYGNNYGSSYEESSSFYTPECPKNSSESDGQCICNVGYETNKDKDACKKTSKKTNDKLCRADFGKYSIWTGKYDKKEKTPMCNCKLGYKWDEEGTSCVKNK